MSSSSIRPLDGFRVLDLTANVAGPLGCQVLADLGAEVIKVEPFQGEAARRITATALGAEGVTPYFTPHNRGKKSVQIDPRTVEGKVALRNLVAGADVLVQAMRPGAMQRHGFGPQDVADINSRCVYVSVSAYGSGSDLEDRPGIDMMVQAESGMLSAQPAGETPRLIPFQLVDGATGHVVAQSVLAALLHRERFGVVTPIEVSMYDVACSLQANYLTLHMNTPPLSAGGTTGRPVAVEPSGIFVTADGYLALAAYVSAHWAAFVEAIDRPDLAADPCFGDQAARSRNAEDLRNQISQELLHRTTAEWVATFGAAGLMAAPISTWGEVVTSELFERRALRLTADQQGSQVAVVRTPARYATFDTNTHAAVPSLGEHNSMIATTTSERLS